MIHPSAIIDNGASIGTGSKIWHFTHVCEHASIGKNCSIGQNCFIANHVLIGDNVKIQNNVSVYEGVIIESDVFVGPSVVFTNVINPRSFIIRKHEYQPTLVKKGASLGANSTIICGNTIGTYAFIGAGTVVTKPVPDFAMVVGNPGRQIAWVSRAGYRLTFSKDGYAQCPENKETYCLNPISQTVNIQQ